MAAPASADKIESIEVEQHYMDTLFGVLVAALHLQACWDSSDLFLREPGK